MTGTNIIKGKGKIFIQLWMLLVFFLINATLAQAATQPQIDNAGSKAIAWLLQNQHNDGSWRSTPGTEVVATSAALDALTNTGVKGYMYATAISWLSNARTFSTDSIAHQTAALYNAGVDVTDNVSLLKTYRGYFDALDLNILSWGPYKGYPGTIPDTTLVLDLFLDTSPSYAYAGNAINYMLNERNSADGGWPDHNPYCLFFGDPNCNRSASQIVPTAQAIITLRGYQIARGWGLQAYINGGMTWLLAQQKVDKSFGDEATGTVRETVQAYKAIVAELGVSHLAAVDALDYIISQQQVDGSWSGQPLQTALALQILSVSPLNDIDSDGIPDLVETILGTDPLVDDSRTFVNGNGESVIGVTTPYAYTTMLYEATPINLSMPNGVAPYMFWSITSGALPDGLTLNTSTGELTGTPTSGGVFTFTYSATDSNATTITSVAQIVVTVIANGDINQDGQVNIIDVMIGQQILSGQVVPTAEELAHGDVAPLVGGVPSPDGQFNTGDLVVIQRKAMGLVTF